MSDLAPREKLACELSYMGTLFWLPLLLCKDRSAARYHANQGLWMLIISCLLCWIVQIVGIIKKFFTAGLFSVLSGGCYFIVFVVMLLSLLYLATQGLKNVFAIHRGDTPGSILFFEEKAIIR